MNEQDSKTNLNLDGTTMPAPLLPLMTNTLLILLVNVLILFVQKLEEMLEKADSAAINAPDLVGQTPLHCYVRRANVDFVIILLSMGNSVDINAQDSEGNTALHMAVMVGEEEINKLE